MKKFLALLLCLCLQLAAAPAVFAAQDAGGLGGEYEEFDNNTVGYDEYYADYAGGGTVYDLLGEYDMYFEPDEPPPAEEFYAEDDDSEIYTSYSFDGENNAQLNGAKYVLDEILVKFKEPRQVPGKEKQLQREISKVAKLGFVENLGVYVVKADDLATNPNAVLSRLKNNRYIEYVEPNYIAEPLLASNDTYYSTFVSVLNMINAQAGWDITTGQNSPLVAIVDTGVASHPDLPAPRSGYSAVSSLTYNNDTVVGHGTTVAGALGAIGNNGTGFLGVNWNANIMAVKVDNASGALSASNVAKGIIWAADNGARVINISIAFANSSTTLKDAIDYAYKKGCVIVAATGNDSASSVAYPARYDNVVGMGGTGDGKTRVSFSNYGAGLDFIAIGSWYATKVGGSYGAVSGTSYASPQAAALASLILTVHPTATQEEVYSLIKAGIKPLGSGSGYDAQTGYGLIDVGKTLQLAKAAADALAKPPEEPRTPPVITLAGFASMTLEYGQPYNETGYSAADCKGVDLTSSVNVTSTVNIWQAGLYTVTYEVADSAGLTARATRAVTVNPEPVIPPPPPTAPKITVIGSNPIKLHATSGTPYTEQGARAVDYDGADISSQVTISGDVTRYVPGTYTLTYTIVSPTTGLSDTATRDVRIIAPDEQKDPRTKYGFSGMAKAGGVITHTGIVSSASGFVDLSVTTIDKNMTINVQLVDTATKKAVLTDTYSAVGAKQYNVGAGKYELSVTVTKASGIGKYAMGLLMPEPDVMLVYSDQEIPLWGFKQEKTGFFGKIKKAFGVFGKIF